MGNILENLKDTINIMGISRQVEAVGVVEAATNEIAKIVPKEEFEVVSYKEGVLKVATSSGSVSSEIKMRLGQDFLKENKITRLVFTQQSSLTEP